jgi:hypothetical protein
MPTAYREIFLDSDVIPKPTEVLGDEEEKLPADAEVPTPTELAKEPDVKALREALAEPAVAG